MHHISVKVSDNLYQEIEQKADQLELKISELVRECLRIGLDNIDSTPKPNLLPNITDIMLQKQTISYALMIHCLLEQFIKSAVEEGELLCDIAETKAKHLIKSLLPEKENAPELI